MTYHFPDQTLRMTKPIRHGLKQTVMWMRKSSTKRALKAQLVWVKILSVKTATSLIYPTVFMSKSNLA